MAGDGSKKLAMAREGKRKGLMSDYEWEDQAIGNLSQAVASVKQALKNTRAEIQKETRERSNAILKTVKNYINKKEDEAFLKSQLETIDDQLSLLVDMLGEDFDMEAEYQRLQEARAIAEADAEQCDVPPPIDWDKLWFP